jgi:hypothetical protein
MNALSKKIADVGQRILATFVVSALGIIGGSAILAPDISVVQAALLAGFASCAQVIERIARASLDGSLTAEEIDEAFSLDDEEDDE